MTAIVYSSHPPSYRDIEILELGQCEWIEYTKLILDIE